jgi:hypothetical protein
MKKSTERTRRWRQRERERLRAQFGGACGECGTEHALEFAHVAKTSIWGRGRGFWQRTRDIKANPESYRLLCRPCHMDLDFGYDPWEPRRPDPAQLELEAVPF